MSLNWKKITAAVAHPPCLENMALRATVENKLD